MQDLKKHIASFFPFAQKQLGFKRPPKLFFVNDKQNAGDALGKTAYYEPETETIKIYVTNRHPKDVLRSFSHELVHHAQNCRGDFDNDTVTEEGYAQSDPHLREMEREAYEKGNMIFRDYCDGLTNNGGLEQMSMTEEKLRGAVRAAIQRLAEKSGGKPDFLDLDKDGDKKEPMKKAAAEADKDKKEVKEDVDQEANEKEIEDAKKLGGKFPKKKVDEASLADDPEKAEEAEAAERAAEGGESETKVNEEDELEESPSHPASDRSQGRDAGRRVKDVNSGERKEVAESTDELKEWYLGTLSEALVKRFTK
jgi:hypothetical protein